MEPLSPPPDMKQDSTMVDELNEDILTEHLERPTEIQNPEATMIVPDTARQSVDSHTQQLSIR